MKKILQSLKEDSVLDFNTRFKKLLEYKLYCTQETINEATYSDTIIDSLESFVKENGKLARMVVCAILDDTKVDYTVKGNDLSIRNTSNDDNRILNFMNSMDTKHYVGQVASDTDFDDVKEIYKVIAELNDFIEYM